jgi:REP element-mobilizing transposase RayT
MVWNDTDSPIAVFITFRCYGTWLHGDERKSVDRHHNKYGSPRIQPKTAWRKYNESKLKHEPVRLNAVQRRAIEKAIRESCLKRGWILYALNVRTNHVHIVVSIGKNKPQSALIAFKANATRQMREDGCWDHEHTPWAEKGSRRLLWNEKSIVEACDYVVNSQGDELPDFDRW